ncbi:MAG: hypothetical protein ACRDI2_00010 [Chloroflexota bacterium]
MDVIILIVAAALATAALVAAVTAVVATRRAHVTLAAMAAEHGRRSADVAALAGQVQAMTGRLETVEADLRAAIERTTRLDDRLHDRLRRIEAELREVTAAAPPPIPSGRTAAKLEDLRAVLRAQAAEAAAGDAERGEDA